MQEATEEALGFTKSKQRAEWISEKNTKTERREYKSRRRESADTAKHLSGIFKKSAKEDKSEFIRGLCNEVQ